MKFSNQILSISILLAQSFVFIRLEISRIKTYKLNNSAYKKRKKGENFWEWLTYSRWRDVIPKFFIIFYFIIIFIRLAALVLCVVLHLFGADDACGWLIVYFLSCFYSLWGVIFAILFSRGFGSWLSRKGMNKRK